MVISRSDSLPAASPSHDDPEWAEEPTNPRMVRVEIVDDSGEMTVPSTLRSGLMLAAGRGKTFAAT